MRFGITTTRLTAFRPTKHLLWPAAIISAMLLGSWQLQAQPGSLQFWQHLQRICGQAYEGTVLTAPANDTIFRDKKLVMHIIQCSPKQVSIPFSVGNDRSRTWVLSLQDSLMHLKHDHRHADGTPDKITMYGGKATNTGTQHIQYFPADQFTVNMLPSAAANIWWIELMPGEYFTYHLRRTGTDRQYSIRFNLKAPLTTTPPLPWGWKE